MEIKDMYIGMRVKPIFVVNGSNQLKQEATVIEIGRICVTVKDNNGKEYYCSADSISPAENHTEPHSNNIENLVSTLKEKSIRNIFLIMEKIFLKSIICFCVISLMAYLIGSFVSASFDLSKWHINVRGIIAAFGVLCFVMWFVEENSNKK